MHGLFSFNFQKIIMIKKKHTLEEMSVTYRKKKKKRYKYYNKNLGNTLI